MCEVEYEVCEGAEEERGGLGDEVWLRDVSSAAGQHRNTHSVKTIHFLHRHNNNIGSLQFPHTNPFGVAVGVYYML